MITLSKRIILALTLGIALPLIGFLLWPNSATETVVAEPNRTIVNTTTAIDFQSETVISLIGTVRAQSEADITAEQAGRITSVPVTLGQSVAAGQIIATLENASEQAAVLQAEGVYDAAVANSAQSDLKTNEAALGVTGALNNIRSELTGAYSTVHGTIFATVDQFFGEPNARIPGLRLSGQGHTAKLNELRHSYQKSLPAWKSRIDNLDIDSDYQAEVALANTEINKTIDLVDTFLLVLSNQNESNQYTEAQLATFSETFNSVRGRLVTTQADIEQALTELDAAYKTLDQAELAASGSSYSTADAEVKQALGALRVAEANLAQTIIRTPIAGTVNELDVATGDFIAGQNIVAKVANNNALEIITAIGEAERDIFTVGDKVDIENTSQGTVSAIAPAVSATTGKLEMRILTTSDNLKNGDIVTITRITSNIDAADDRIFVPLAAVRFAQTDGFVFVIEDEKLVERPITLGLVRGGSVEIKSGLTKHETFVSDARGLNAGTLVTTSN